MTPHLYYITNMGEHGFSPTTERFPTIDSLIDLMRPMVQYMEIRTLEPEPPRIWIPI